MSTSSSRTDSTTAQGLSRSGKILGWGFSCYVDVNDPELAQEQGIARDRALAGASAEKLRSCRCIVYA